MSDLLIAFSGGVNSTYLAWRFANETTHNIKLIYMVESWVDTRPLLVGRNDREKVNAQNIADWITANVRSVDFEIRTNTHPYYNWPRGIRAPNFIQQHDTGPVRQRYKYYKDILDEFNPDIFATGLSVENTSTDCHPYHKAEYDDGTRLIQYAGVRELNPTTTADEDYNALAAVMSGRFEQLEALPDALKAMSFLHCPQDHGKYSCSSCGYHAVLAERPDLTGRQLDEIFAEYGSYGKWRSEADPETYTWRGKPQHKIRELLEVV